MDAISKNINPIFLRSKGFWVTFAICITIIAGTFHPFFSYIAFGLSVISMILLSEEDGLCLLMFLVPFASVFKRSAESQSFFTYLMLFYVLLHFIRKPHIRRGFLLSLLFLLMFLTAQLLLSVSILRMIKFVANIFLIYIAANMDDEDNTKKIYISYILGVAITSSIVALNIIPDLSKYIETKEMRYEYGYVSRFAGMYPDPNYYSINVIISLCLIVILNHNRKLSALTSIGLAALMVTFAVMTLSKSAFLMLLLPIVLLLYSKIKKKNYLLLVAFVLSGIILVQALFAGKFEFFNTILYRFTDAKDLSSLTTGRYGIWQTYISFLTENPETLLLGKGFGAEILNSRATHNTYIDLLYYLGILGTFLLGIVFYSIIKIGKRATKPGFLNYSIFICIAMMYFFLSELFYFDWAYHVIIAIFVLQMNMKSAHLKNRGNYLITECRSN